MKMKRMLAIVLCAVMLMMLAACGSSDAGNDAGNDEEAGNVEETRTVTVGTTGSGEPYSLIDASGNWTGIEADLWAEVEARTGLTVEVKQLGDLASVFGELESGRTNVAANCYAITATRLETYVASDPIYADAQVIIVKPDSSYETFEDLRGCTIGVTSGQAAQSIVEEMAPEYDWTIVTYEDSSAGFQDCDLGRVDCYANTVSNIVKAEAAQGLEFRILEEKLFGNNVGWFFAATDEGIALRDELNAVLSEMRADGTLSEIVTKWMGEDMTELVSDEWLTADR